MTARLFSKSPVLLAAALITAGCDSDSPKPAAGPPAKTGPTSGQTAPLPPPPQPTPVITLTEVKGKDYQAGPRAFIAKYSGDVQGMARALKEMEPSEENVMQIVDILSVFTENPQLALAEYARISDAIPDSVRTVFASDIGRHAAKDAAPDIWIKRISGSEAPDYYKAIIVSEMFNRMPSSFNTSGWLSQSTASAEMKFAAAATERSLKEVLANPAGMDIVFDNVPEKHQPALAEMLAGSAVSKVDGKLMDTLLAMQNPAKEHCLAAAVLHWGDRNLNEALQWIEAAPVQNPLKARMVESLLPEIETGTRERGRSG